MFTSNYDENHIAGLAGCEAYSEKHVRTVPPRYAFVSAGTGILRSRHLMQSQSFLMISVDSSYRQE